MNLKRMIRSLIRRAVVSLSMPDEGDFQLVQISYLDKTAKMEVIWPYGMGGRLPVDAIPFVFNVEGMEENKAGLGTAPTLRFKVNAEGEVWFGNPLSGSVVFFRENGDIEKTGLADDTETISGTKKIIAPDIEIGSSGATLRSLIDDRLIALFNVHVHPDPVSGNTGAPTVLLVPGAQETADLTAS